MAEKNLLTIGKTIGLESPMCQALGNATVPEG